MSMFEDIWKSKPANKLPVMGRKPTADKEFYTNWSKENSKETIKTVNAALGQLLTLSTALFAGMVALWKGLPVTDPVKVLALVSLLIAVITSLFSAMPYYGKYDSNDTESIKSFYESTIKYKLTRLKRSKWAIVIAISTVTFALTDDVFKFTDHTVDLVHSYYQKIK